MAIAPSGVGFVLKRIESAVACADTADANPTTVNHWNTLRIVIIPFTKTGGVVL